MSLAAIKRRLTLGAKVQMVRHDWYPMSVLEGGKLFGVRSVKQVQGNAVQFSNGSWLYWPKAGSIRMTPLGFEVKLDDGGWAALMAYEWRD